ncbi:MAG: hypothetical protein ACE5HN_02000 [Nitrospiria bacterium]
MTMEKGGSVKKKNLFLNLLFPIFCFMMIATMAGCADESDLPTEPLPATIPPFNVGPTENTAESPASDVGVDPSLAIGSDGFARISYYDATISDVGAGPSIVIGADGFARISYYDATKGDLRFARCTDADCTNRVITSVDGTRDAGDVGSNTSLAIGLDGFPRISYYDATNGDLKFARCTDADCTTPAIMTVDATGDVGSNTSLAIGPDGFARISYYDATNGNLKFARCTDADCTTPVITTVDSVGDVGSNSSLANGVGGFARISYYDATNGDLKFVLCTNDDCIAPQIRTVDSTGDVGSNSSLAMGANGFARISYYDATNGDLKFALCINADCISPQIRTVDSTGDVGSNSSLDLGIDGFVRIGYYDATNGDLKFARCTDANCTTSPIIKTLDDTNDVGVNSSIAVGTDGFARISYYDATNGDLEFARCADVDCTTLVSLAVDSTGDVGDLKFVRCTDKNCTNREITIVDSTGDIGINSSLAIWTNGAGADGLARISYYDVTNGDLKFARCNNADCTNRDITTVASTGDVGINSSLAIGTDGFARISYNDATNGNLKFARCADADCTTSTVTTVDEMNDVEANSSLAIWKDGVGADGFARISYWNVLLQQLKFVLCNDADCTAPTITMVDTRVDPDGIVGSGSSIAIDPDGLARMSYFGEGSLKFVRCINDVCTTHTNPPTKVAQAILGIRTSLAIGPAPGRFARIAYFDGPNGVLNFVRCADDDCTAPTITTVDSALIVGEFPSLAIGADGFARIAYYRRTTGDLRFARCSNADCTAVSITTVDR